MSEILVFGDAKCQQGRMCQGTEYDHIDEFIPGRVFGDTMCVSECTTLRKDAQECRQNGTGSSTVQDASVVLHAQRFRGGGGIT